MDLKYFISPKVLPLPVGLLMIFTGLASKVETKFISFEIETQKGVILALIGSILVFYSLYLSRKFMSVESTVVSDLIDKEHNEQEIIKLLKIRASLSFNQELILNAVESSPHGISREDLETKLNHPEPKELSLRLNNLILQELLTSEPYGRSFFYRLHPKYAPHSVNLDKTITRPLI